MLLVTGLPQHLLFEHHYGVGGEHRRGPRVTERREPGQRLLAGHSLHESLGRFAGSPGLVDRSVDDSVVDADLVE